MLQEEKVNDVRIATMTLNRTYRKPPRSLCGIKIPTKFIVGHGT